jgi:hypothetical protein
MVEAVSLLRISSPKLKFFAGFSFYIVGLAGRISETALGRQGGGPKRDLLSFTKHKKTFASSALAVV